MEQIPLINEFLIIFVLSIIVLLLCYRVHIPAVVGFLLTGVISGPYGFALVKQVEDVQSLSNIGIILLLFTVGMEISVKKILEIKRLFFAGGVLQVLLTMLGGFVIAKAIGRPTGEAIFLGCLLALSSTAVVLRMMVQKGEADTPHGRGTLAILIFQDFCAVPMMLIIPILAGENSDWDWELISRALEGLLIISAVFAAGWWIVPKLLFHVARTRIRELFLLTVISICLAVAWASQLAGLSLSLGAFLAGLIISNSDFSHEAISDIIPFQDLFISFFFVSVGMLLDISFVYNHPLLIIGMTILVVALKAIAVTFSGVCAGLPLRTAAWMGLSLAQISEFSFVLAKTGSEHGLAPPMQYQLFLAIAILSIALTPWLINYAHAWAGFWDRLPLPNRLKRGYSAPKSKEEQKLEKHVIIVGFGLSGNALAHTCKESSIPYVIVEMNPHTVRREQLNGQPIHYGDASHETVLDHLQIQTAAAVAIVINDSAGAVRIIKKVRQLNPTVYTIVRTRYMQDVKQLYSIGANDVIPDEYGSAVEIFTRVLHNYSVPKDKIQELVTSSLAEHYELLRMHYYHS